MMIENVLGSENVHTHKNDGVTIVSVAEIEQGLLLAKKLLYSLITNRTILYLSGGNTPATLYATLAKEEKIRPGVVGLIDERYGDPMHASSNEKMIASTGLLRYFSMLDTPYYAMLRGVLLEETAGRYDELIRSLQTVYPKSIGILGMGSDGHIAGILPNRSDFDNPLFKKDDSYSLVKGIEDAGGIYKKRVTQTFLGLSLLDTIIVLVFGEEKKKALTQMFEEGKEEDIPARFLKRKDVAPKVLLITDQQI
jgi:6-phosphogluconolactonase/glucosamine-6-phosphate isomerase/deaminase